MDAEQLIGLLFEELPNLRLLAVVAEQGSVSAAGKALCKSPSVITRAVADLERCLGEALVDRGTRKFSLTPYGRVLVERARRIEVEAATTMAGIERHKGASVAALQQLLYSGRKLHLLMTVAEAGNISKAAARLGVSQPALSQSLGRLEEAVGVRLFHRDLKGAVPSETANRLRLHAKRIQAELRHAGAELVALSGGNAGRVVIGSLPMARARVLPRALASCRERWPGLQVQIVEASREMLLAQLRTGEIDALISVTANNFDPDGILCTPLFRDELGVVAGADHPLATGGPYELADLGQAAWVLPWKDSISGGLFERQFAACGIMQSRACLFSGDFLTIRSLLEQGDMLAFASLGLFEREIAAGMLARVDVAMPRLERQVQLLRRASVQLPRPALALLDAIEAVSADL